MEIRQEMIRLINQTLKTNGMSEPPANEALMNAAQACSNRRCTWRHALDNWIHSPGHFQTMIDSRCDCIGVGVTQYDDCYMFVGGPNSVNFYA